jgi:hypothetical protein
MAQAVRSLHENRVRSMATIQSAITGYFEASGAAVGASRRGPDGPAAPPEYRAIPSRDSSRVRGLAAGQRRRGRAAIA